MTDPIQQIEERINRANKFWTSQGKQNPDPQWLDIQNLIVLVKWLSEMWPMTSDLMQAARIRNLIEEKKKEIFGEK